MSASVPLCPHGLPGACCPHCEIDMLRTKLAASSNRIAELEAALVRPAEWLSDRAVARRCFKAASYMLDEIATMIDDPRTHDVLRRILQQVRDKFESDMDDAEETVRAWGGEP